MEDELKKILDEIYLESSKECTLRSVSTHGLNFDFASLYPNMKMFSMDDIKKSNRIKKIKNIFNVLH